MDSVVWNGVSLESSSILFQCSWLTRKKRTLKPFKSKSLSSSSGSREEECTRVRWPVRSEVLNKKRKHWRADNDDSGVVKRNPKRRRKATSDEKEQHSEDDDCTLENYISKMRRIIAKSREEEEEDWMSKSNSKRRDRRKVELEEDKEWEEELELISKIKATSRSRSRNLGCAASERSPENVTDVSRESHSRSPTSEVSDSLLKNGISNDCTSMKNTSTVTCLYISSSNPINVLLY